MRHGIFLLLLIVAALWPPPAAALADPTLGSRWVEADLDLSQPDLTQILLTGTLRIHKHDVNGRTYSAADMGDSYARTLDLGAGTGEAFVARMEASVRDALDDALARDFPTATRTIDDITVDRASLAAPRSDAYDPPVVVTVVATIDRTLADLGLGSLSFDAVRAAFDAGARVQADLGLSADPGYVVAFTLRAPASPSQLSFASALGGALQPDGSVLVRIDNARGRLSLPLDVTVALVDAQAKPPTKEDLRSVVDVRLGELRPGATSLPVAASVHTDLRALGIAERAPGALPPRVELPFVSADGLRALRAAGALTDAELASAEGSLVDALRADLAGALGSQAAVSGALSRADLARAGSKPYNLSDAPLGFDAEASGAYPLRPSTKDLDTALDVGAALRFDIDLGKTREATTYTVHAPPGLVFASARGATLLPGATAATLDTAQASLAVRKLGVWAPTAEDARVAVLVDISDLDVSLGQAASGDFGTLRVAVTVEGSLAAIRVTDEMRSRFGEGVELDHISSDGLRLVRERGLLSDEDLDKVESSLLDTVAQGLAAALGATPDIAGGFDRASFESGAPGAPITFRASTRFERPVSGSANGAQALALYSIPQSFTFGKVRDLDTAYTLVLPRGLVATGIHVDGGSSSVEQSGGRQRVTVTPRDSSATATMSIAVTPTFIIVKFWPVVLLAILLLLLVIGAPIALLMLKRKRKAADVAAPK